MKKQLVLFAMCTTLATPAMAVETDFDLYGVFAYSLSQYESDAAGDDFDAENNGSFLGLSVSGEERGITAFAVYERGFDRFNSASTNSESEDFVRQFYGGLSGRYGVLSYGRKSTTYKQAGRKLDPFYDSSIVGFNAQFANEGASYGLSNLTNAFASNTVEYQAPEWHGFSAHGALYINDNGEAQGNDDDDYGLGLAYEDHERGFGLGVEYLDSNGGDVVFGVGKLVEFEATRLYGVYGYKALTVGASYEHVDISDESDPRGYGIISASYQLLPDIVLALTYGHLQDVVPNAVANPDGINGDGISIGAFYDIISGLKAYVAARTIDLDSGNEVQTYAVGFSYEFALDLN